MPIIPDDPPYTPCLKWEECDVEEITLEKEPKQFRPGKRYGKVEIFKTDRELPKSYKGEPLYRVRLELKEQEKKKGTIEVVSIGYFEKEIDAIQFAEFLLIGYEELLNVETVKELQTGLVNALGSWLEYVYRKREWIPPATYAKKFS